MRYWLTSLVCLFVLSGCGGGGSSSSSTADTSSEVDTVEESTASSEDSSLEEDASEETSVDYTLVGCEDDLQDVVALINEYRAEAQVCGETSYPAVDALVWNDLLTLAAEEHSANMANYDFFSHTGLDDSTVGDRVSAQGYTWYFVAENLAAGQTSAAQALVDLMESEGHCKNIMSATATEIGLACAYNGDATYKAYWTQVFADPQS